MFQTEQIKRANKLFGNDCIFLRASLSIPVLSERRYQFNGLYPESPDGEPGSLPRGGDAPRGTESVGEGGPSPAPSPPSLPPYFVKGSIIQLADGDLKRVEELKTEDFIQSAEISSELKIDSSTVERIDQSPASRHLAVVQFSVGEHRAQVT